MHKYISYPRGGQAKIAANVWQVSRDEHVSVDQLTGDNVIVSFQYWLKHQAALQARYQPQHLGVFIQVDDDVIDHRDSITEGASHWSVIAVDFPIFRDGRGFSTAAILREQFAWDKELRSIGDVLIDQLVQMARVGFDAFELREDQNLETALVQLKRFPVKMQNDWRSLRTLRVGNL
jgi:uncharacterized protein (DUF934 family)